jgi:hypothetical protein
MGKIGQEELRRSARVSVCCRVEVRQPHGVWTAVTQDLSPRGCRVSSAQTPRLGARLRLTLSSDLFPDELTTLGEVVWVSGAQLGILFVEEKRRRGALSPAEWVRRVMQHGAAQEGGAAAAPERVLPVVSALSQGGAAIPILSRRRGSG